MQWRRHDYRWTREGSTVKVRRHVGWYDATSVSGREPWRPNREEPDNFAGMRRTKRTPATRAVITEDADLIRRTYRRHEQAEQMEEASRTLRNIYDRITMNVIEDMEAARLQQAHDDFMAEYGDEDAVGGAPQNPERGGPEVLPPRRGLPLARKAGR